MIEGQSRKARVYSKAQSRQMFKRINATKAENRAKELETALSRLTDQFEIAKNLLRRNRIVVYAHAVVMPGSELIVVGQQLLTVPQVIAYAERYQPRTTPQGGSNANRGTSSNRS